MTPRLLRIIVALQKTRTAVYTPDEGAKCPVCEAFGLNPPKAPVTSSARPVRLHKCPQCGGTFKSVQHTTENICRPVETTDSIARKRKRRHIEDR